MCEETDTDKLGCVACLLRNLTVILSCGHFSCSHFTFRGGRENDKTTFCTSLLKSSTDINWALTEAHAVLFEEIFKNESCLASLNADWKLFHTKEAEKTEPREVMTRHSLKGRIHRMSCNITAIIPTALWSALLKEGIAERDAWVGGIRDEFHFEGMVQ